MSYTPLYSQLGYRNSAVNNYPQQFPEMRLSMFQPQQPNNELIGLHGLDSAKQYPIKPNTTVPTFDMDSDHAFILNADANGVLSVKILSFKVISEEEYRKAVEADTPVQIPRSEYDELLNRVKNLEEELKDAKQSIRKRNGEYAAAKSAVKPAASVDRPDV